MTMNARDLLKKIGTLSVVATAVVGNAGASGVQGTATLISNPPDLRRSSTTPKLVLTSSSVASDMASHGSHSSHSSHSSHASHVSGSGSSGSYSPPAAASPAPRVKVPKYEPSDKLRWSLSKTTRRPYHRTYSGLREAKNVSAYQALIKSIKSDDAAGVRDALASDKALLETADDRGQTSLFIAVTNGSVSVVQELVVEGADPNLTDAAGLIPLDYVARKATISKGDLGIAQILISHGSDPNGGSGEVIARLILNLSDASKGAKSEAGNDSDSPATDLIIGLLQHGADLETKDNHGNTLLLTALRENCPDVALELIKLGADVKATNEFDQNALHLVAMYEPANSETLIQELIKKGTSLTAKDSFGATPAQTATALKHEDIVAMLNRSIGGG